MCRMMLKIGRLFENTDMAMPILLKSTRTFKNKEYHGNRCDYSSQDLLQNSGLEITILEEMFKF